MSDVISRQTAVDELVKMLGYCFQADEEVIEAVVTTINELPPSQLSTNLAEVGADVPDNNVGELINRQQAIDAVEHITTSMSICVNSDECHGMKRMQRQAVIELANMPAIQPKRGKWIYCEDSIADCVDGYRCDKCGFFVPWDYMHKGIDFIQDYNFCPHCGSYNGGKNEI